MPIYVYEVVLEDDEPGMQFEVFQQMSEPALTHHPTTGQPVRRIVASCNISGRWSDAGAKRALSDNSLERSGFTKYVKSDDGRYEKTVGKGPDIIQNGKKK